MIIHRREIDVGRRDDVAQRDVAKAAVGVKPLGGGEDGGPGLIGRHVMGPMRRERCNSNSCMKLSFEEPEMSIRDCERIGSAAASRVAAGREMALRRRKRRADSAAQRFQKR